MEKLCEDEGCPHAGTKHICYSSRRIDEAEAFVAWADGYFAAPDYSVTASGAFVKDWMRCAFAAWQARAALERKP